MRVWLCEIDDFAWLNVNPFGLDSFIRTASRTFLLFQLLNTVLVALISETNGVQ